MHNRQTNVYHMVLDLSYIPVSKTKVISLEKLHIFKKIIFMFGSKSTGSDSTYIAYQYSDNKCKQLQTIVGGTLDEFLEAWLNMPTSTYARDAVRTTACSDQLSPPIPAGVTFSTLTSV